MLNYHHIKATLWAADSSALQRISSAGTPTAAAAAARQQQLPPESPAAGRRGLGAAGAAAIKECEVGVLVRGRGGDGSGAVWQGMALGVPMLFMTERRCHGGHSCAASPYSRWPYLLRCLVPKTLCMCFCACACVCLLCWCQLCPPPPPADQLSACMSDRDRLCACGCPVRCVSPPPTGPAVCVHVAVCGGPAGGSLQRPAGVCEEGGARPEAQRGARGTAHPRWVGVGLLSPFS